jgi:glutamyl-Q tRNA(Asp) synthetase
MPGFRTRFAPSPTGYLHLGHAFSALTAWDMSEGRHGECLLRIENLDGSRARSEYEAAIVEDLSWLGLTWPQPVLRQSEHLERYAAALDQLTEMGLTYPCSCTRADIRTALSAPQEGAAPGEPAIAVYPGICRGRSMTEWKAADAIRLDLGKALEWSRGSELHVEEAGPGHPGMHRLDPANMRTTLGDVVLGRKDTRAAAYHLTVVVDDALQGITHVVRGQDLWQVTPLHRLLQLLLGLPAPVWYHHALVRDEWGRRLAKRDDARALRTLRAEGETPEQIRAQLGMYGRMPSGRAS